MADPSSGLALSTEPAAAVAAQVVVVVASDSPTSSAPAAAATPETGAPVAVAPIPAQPDASTAAVADPTAATPALSALEILMGAAVKAKPSPTKVAAADDDADAASAAAAAATRSAAPFLSDNSAAAGESRVATAAPQPEEGGRKTPPSDFAANAAKKRKLSGTDGDGYVPTPGDMCWGKFEGYAWWPAKVLERDSIHGGALDGTPSDEDVPGNHLLRFFGTYDAAWLHETRTQEYTEQNLVRLKKKCRSKIFYRALNEAAGYRETGAEPEGFSQPARNARTGRGAADGEVEEEAVLPDDQPPPMTAEELAYAIKTQKQDKILRKLGLIPPIPLY